MLFNSYVFWAFYLTVFLFYRLLPHRAQNVLLLVASYVFYGYWDWRFLFVILFSTIVDFFAAIGIGRSRSSQHRKLILFASITVQLGLLGFFKYYGFFAHELSELLARLGMPLTFPILKVLLPIGISFYTFQTMSYTIDAYRGQFKYRTNFIDFALFVSFFPHLVAGPIVRAAKLLPQFEQARVRRHDDFRVGLYYVITGLFKKVVVADNLAVIVNTVFRTPAGDLSGADCLVAMYAFAFQIYCDFSGYSQIAQGVARWMNIDLTTNFRMPYLSESPSDFWSRWHISLSTWFRDYVYVPLARRLGTGRWRLYLSVVAVMLLSGLWHGAARTFIVWGLYHGLLLCAWRLWAERRWQFFKFVRRAEKPRERAHSFARLCKIIVTFHLVCLGWLLFRAESVTQAVAMLGRVFSDSSVTPFAIASVGLIAFYAGPLMLYEWWVEKRDNLLALTDAHWLARASVYCYCALMLWFFPPPSSNVFIYFQF